MMSETLNTMVDMQESIEEWRRIPSNPDYEASTFGRIRSRKRLRPQILSPYTHKLGYLRLSVDSRATGVHQLVAAAFHGPCPTGMEVDHINGVRNDNRPENLRYLTRQQNMARIDFQRAEECEAGHAMSGENLYIRPSNGRHECRTCNRARTLKIKSTNDPCSYDGCSKPATCRRSTDRPICEMHYQRERNRGKRAAALAEGVA